MTIEIYLAETKYAVEQLFTNYLFYHQLGTELSTALRNHKSFVFSPEYNSDPETQIMSKNSLAGK